MNMHTPTQILQHQASLDRKQRLWGDGKQETKMLAAPTAKAQTPKVTPIALVVAKPDSQAQRIRILEAQLREKDMHIADLQASSLRMSEMIAGYIAKEANLDLVDAIDDEMAEAVMPKRPIRAIVEEVLQDYPGITWEDVKSIHRSRNLIPPRHHCMVAVYQQRPDLSFPAIGRHFDRDHTSVLYAVKKFEALRKEP